MNQQQSLFNNTVYKKNILGILFLVLLFYTWGLSIYSPKTSFAYQYFIRFYWEYNKLQSEFPKDCSNPIFNQYRIFSEMLKSYDKDFPSSTVDKNNMQDCAFDIYGMFINLMQQNALSKVRYKSMRLQNGALSLIVEKCCDMTENAQNIIQFNDYLQKKNIPFLYIIAPHKNYKYQPLEPIGVKDYGNAHGDSLRTLIQDNVDCLDIRDRYKSNPDIHYQNFYRGDTHWKIDYVYEAFTMVMNHLEHEYHFVFEERLKSISNFTQYESSKDATDLSKQFGRYLTTPEKFLYLKPKFSTHLSVHSKNSSQYQTFDINYEGQFDMQYLCDNYPNLSIDNCNALNDKRVLIVGDSFTPPLMCLLSLVFKHIEFHSAIYYEENLYETVEKFNPDLVICLYTARQSDLFIFDKNRGKDNVETDKN